MRKVVLYIGVSLDGYIARRDGSIDWLDEANGEGDNGYSEFLKTIDTVIMGKKTYDHVLELTNHKYPYEGMKSFIYTRSESRTEGDLIFTKDKPEALIDQLKKEEGADIWMVGGAEILDDFMKKDLIDEYIITTVPVILGDGIPLFRPGNPETKLSYKRTVRFGDYVQSHYTRS
ncbi:dihydrofolate reductase family protein [Metabacillus indicus]|uniref:dihydrofolate reductase family protein n=1 Tax=Metabacillus indicus TaxID=246786 RepID=UPI0031772215